MTTWAKGFKQYLASSSLELSHDNEDDVKDDDDEEENSDVEEDEADIDDDDDVEDTLFNDEDVDNWIIFLINSLPSKLKERTLFSTWLSLEFFSSASYDAGFKSFA